MIKHLGGRKLGRTGSHRKALLCNMATSLFLHERIETTVAKAKALRPFAEKLITGAKQGKHPMVRRSVRNKLAVITYRVDWSNYQSTRYFPNVKISA